MSTRIRYERTDDPLILKSVQVFQHPTNGGRYRVQLNFNDNEFRVLDDASGFIAAFGKVKNRQQMQKHVKFELKKLGILFTSETNARKPYRARVKK